MDATIRTHNLQRHYQMGTEQIHALRGVDLTVNRGEYVAIMGPSGSGKSTLLQCTAGLDQPTDGQVLIGGVNLSTLSERERTELRRDRLGFVFQSFNLITSLTAAQTS